MRVQTLRVIKIFCLFSTVLDRNFKHFIPMGSTHIFCFILAMQFNFHIFEVIQNITVNVLDCQCSFRFTHIFKLYNVLESFMCFHVFMQDLFFLLKNLLYILFQHFKDANPLFSGFFHVVSPNTCFFFLFSRFFLCVWFSAVIPK